LRSLVVLETRRHQCFGGTLVDRAEGVARLDGVERLHLLTTSAAPFFRTIGYLDADRAAAPPSITSSTQFTSLCPASAFYLVKELT
jgi:amino-acid N-acetyltransferase